MATISALPAGRPATVATSLGDQAVALIAASGQRLVDLQPAVLRDRDPEPLHQMRVAMRRLRATLDQFAPALDLPSGLRPARLARHGRRLGLARDLDVLRHRLDQDLLPHLPAAELQALRPVLRQLRRERKLAAEQLEATLRSGSYRRDLARLQTWLRCPRLTPLAAQPLADWLLPLQLPSLSRLLGHAGWLVSDPLSAAEPLHELRKRCKACRYAMENLAPLDTALLPWLARLRQAQQLLGDLNDLQVLQGVIAEQLRAELATELPALHGLLQQRIQMLWCDWSPLAAQLGTAAAHRRLLRDLAAEPPPANQDHNLDLLLNNP